MQTVRVTMTDAIYAAVWSQARREGIAVGTGSGVPAIMRKALRTYLNRTGHATDVLDMDDTEYLQWLESQEM